MRKGFSKILNDYFKNTDMRDHLVDKLVKHIEKVHFPVPTSSVDINNDRIFLGDKVGYDFDDNNSVFTVVFEDNAFRKEIVGWDETLKKPMLEFGTEAKEMRLKIIEYTNAAGKREKSHK